jgi:GDPmannose 4,6-dehydratase
VATTTALVTGVAGQDGVLLARRLLADGHRVVGTRLPGPLPPLAPYLAGVELREHDIRDVAGFERLLVTEEPDEIYNLAGFTSVGASWDHRAIVEQVNATAVEQMLQALVAWRDRTGREPRFFQASSSEVFGPAALNPQREDTAHDPQNPYAESKSRAHALTVRAREAHGLFASVGILYNHESPLRDSRFVTRKITRAAAEIATGTRESLTLGNLDVSRDWGAADDYVLAMQAALQHDEPGDFIIATGRLHSLKELLELAFAAAGVADPWAYVQQDEALLRTADAPGLTGDPGKAQRELGWAAVTSFEDLVAEMVRVDLERLRSGVEESPDYV